MKTRKISSLDGVTTEGRVDNDAKKKGGSVNEEGDDEIGRKSEK